MNKHAADYNDYRNNALVQANRISALLLQAGLAAPMAFVDVTTKEEAALAKQITEILNQAIPMAEELVQIRMF